MPKGIYRRTPEHCQKISQGQLGRLISLETRGKIRLARFGKKHTLETREKMRQAMLGNKYSLGFKHTPEARERIRQGRLGTKRSPETCEKLREVRLRQRFPAKMTSIERLLHDEFKKRRLKFEMHKTMFGRFQPDFVFEQARLIVQADGDYWHSLPKSKRFEAHLAGLALADNWTVWRFGGREIEMHASICARAVARFVRGHH